MVFKFLLTLLLLFIAPHESALAPVLSEDDTLECSEDYYWEGEHNYYTWESCLFDYSGTIDDDPKLTREAHQELYEQVWSDYMGDTDPPRLRRGQTAIEEVCEPLDEDGEEWPWGCFSAGYEPCGPWLMCLVPETVVVKNMTQRLLLHEVAHAIHSASRWHPYWGSGSWGADLGTGSHTIDYRCLLLEIYRNYTDQVADDAYEMLHNVCVANGWTRPG